MNILVVSKDLKNFPTNAASCTFRLKEVEMEARKTASRRVASWLQNNLTSTGTFMPITYLVVAQADALEEFGPDARFVGTYCANCDTTYNVIAI